MPYETGKPKRAKIFAKIQLKLLQPRYEPENRCEDSDNQLNENGWLFFAQV
jgi:hypothetical protein